MAFLQLGVFVLLTISSLVSGQNLKCPYAECTCFTTFVDCTRRNLKEIPALISDHSPFFTHVDFTGNQLTDIPAGALPTTLDTLNLRENPIETISQDAFAQTPNLHTLRLSYANMTALPFTLAFLDNLRTFEISSTPITTWDDNILNQLGHSVVDLNVANCSIRGFPAWLNHFSRLVRLNLNDNSQLQNLRSTSLSLWGDSLIELHLSRTAQTSLASLDPLTKLEILDLSGNRITDSVELSYELIQDRDTLQQLTMNDCGLTTLPRLGELTKLTELYLARNSIKAETTEEFPKALKTLVLEGNQFESIPEGVRSLTSLTDLNLASNKITSIGMGEFPANSQILTLHLGSNAITSIHERAFETIIRTEFLYLSFTALDRLPVALKSFRVLNHLWLSGSPTLECTCDEKELAAWFQSHPEMSVYGDCNGEDIREYFTLASSIC